MPKTYMLKTINKDREAYGGFVWPESGRVECPDWDPTPECGGGLHGALMGQGDGSLFDWSNDAIWLVLEIDSETIVDLKGKVKVPYCDIVYSGDRIIATNKIIQLGGTCVIGSVATAGDYGNATAGNSGTATAGDYGTATVGDDGIAIAGNDGTSTAGYGGIATAGDYGTAIAGDYGTAIAGDYGTAIAGNDGTSTVGNDGIATAGDYGTATVGHGGTATVGHDGIIVISFYDGRRTRKAVGYVGEDGITHNTSYIVEDGKLIKKESE